MTLTNIQHTAANCFSLASSSAASAVRWTGRNIQSLGHLTVNAGQSACNGIIFVGAKCGALAKAVISSASMYANMGWQVAKYAGARSWECAKIGGAYGAEKTVALFSAVMRGTGAALSGLKYLAGKVGAAGMTALTQLRACSTAVGAAIGVKVSGGLHAAGILAGTYPVATGTLTLLLAGTALYYAGCCLNRASEGLIA